MNQLEKSPAVPGSAWKNPALRHLAQSSSYTVSAEYEVAFVESPSLDQARQIGSFYGDPSAAAISQDELWCVVVGRKILVKNLASLHWDGLSPRPNYAPDWSYGDKAEDTLVFNQVRAENGHRFIVTAFPSHDQVQEFILDADLQTLELHQTWPLKDYPVSPILFGPQIDFQLDP